MNLPDLKQLDKVIALCRKRGVSEITVGEITLKLGSKPTKAPKHEEPVAEDQITDEELLFWSSGNLTESKES
jgi:hypothetical protein